MVIEKPIYHIFSASSFAKKNPPKYFYFFLHKKKVFLHVGLCHHIAVLRLIYECKFLRASENIDFDLAAEVN